jgi:hypothetical protein
MILVLSYCFQLMYFPHVSIEEISFSEVGHLSAGIAIIIFHLIGRNCPGLEIM